MMRSLVVSVTRGIGRLCGGPLGLVGVATLVYFGYSTLTKPDGSGVEADRPFAQASRRDQKSQVLSIGFAPDGSRLASVTIAGDVWLNETIAGRSSCVGSGPLGSARSLAFSPDGRVLTVAGDRTYNGPDAEVDGTGLRMWDVVSGAELPPLSVDDGGARRVVFSRDGAYFAVGGDRGNVSLWEWKTRRRLADWKGHRGAINLMTFSPDGTTLATAASSGELKLWDVASRSERADFRSHPAGRKNVVAMAFTPDGTRLATACYGDPIVGFHDARNGELRATIRPSDHAVLALSFAPDGSMLAITTEGGGASLWELGSGRQVGSIVAPGGPLLAIAFSGDGRTVATGGRDGNLRIWGLEEILGRSSHGRPSPSVRGGVPLPSR